MPALLAAGVPPTQALATNKLQSSFGSFSATLYFVRQGVVSLKTMRLAIACTFVGAALGAEAVQYIDASLLTSLIRAADRHLALFSTCAYNQNSQWLRAFV